MPAVTCCLLEHAETVINDLEILFAVPNEITNHLLTSTLSMCNSSTYICTCISFLSFLNYRT